MNTPNQKSQADSKSTTSTDTKKTSAESSTKAQTPGQKQTEKNLTEKDVNPSKQEKQIIHEHGKGEQQTGNKAGYNGSSADKPEAKEYKKTK